MSPCALCGREFGPKRPSQRFCSPACGAKGKRHSGPELLAERFWRFARRADGCWSWSGHIDVQGYPHMGSRRAHRVSYEIHKGPIGVGLYVRHLCNNPGCVNPDHLEVGTQADNMRDMVSAGRSTRGARHPNAKLTPDDVAEVHRLLRAGLSQREIAARFGVHQSNIAQIKRGATWSHVSVEAAHA